MVPPITPEPLGVASISYKKMVQPRFDQHCAACHMGDGKARATLNLTGRPGQLMGGQFSEPDLTLIGPSAYNGSMMDKKNYAGGSDVEEGGAARINDGPIRTFAPKSRFSYASPLINRLRDGKDCNRNLPPDALRILMAWVDCSAPYRDEEELMDTPAPLFHGIEVIPVRPEMRSAPNIARP